MKIPLILSREPAATSSTVPQAGMPATGGLEQVGKEITGLAITLRKQADEQRKQDLQAFDAETWTALDLGAKTLRVAQAETDDPDEYQRITAKGFRDLHQAAQQQAGSDPDRQAIVSKRYQQVLRSEADTFATGLITRRHNKSLASIGQLEERTREQILATTDPEELHRLNGEFRLAVEEAPYLNAAEKQRLAHTFQERMKTDWLALRAMNDPLGFSVLGAQGQFDSLALERGSKIAETELRAREQRNRTLNEEMSRETERSFWQQAKERRLDRTSLEAAADWFKWPKDKVDNLWRTQLGLKTPSPDADALLTAAMEPVNKVDPTMQDVDRAWDNLTKLAGDVPRESVEYERQVTRLRNLRNAIIGRGNADENRERAQAMRRLGILLDKHIRKSRQPRYAQQMAKWREEILLRPAAELPGFLTEIENDLMHAAKSGAEVQQDIEGLKGLRK